MTGRDLIIYILKHGLEDEPIFEDGLFKGMLTISAVAEKLGAGVETVRAMVVLGRFHPIQINGRDFFTIDEIDEYLNRKTKGE